MKTTSKAIIESIFNYNNNMDGVEEAIDTLNSNLNEKNISTITCSFCQEETYYFVTRYYYRKYCRSCYERGMYQVKVFLGPANGDESKIDFTKSLIKICIDQKCGLCNKCTFFKFKELEFFEIERLLSLSYNGRFPIFENSFLYLFNF